MLTMFLIKSSIWRCSPVWWWTISAQILTVHIITMVVIVVSFLSFVPISVIIWARSIWLYVAMIYSWFTIIHVFLIFKFLFVIFSWVWIISIWLTWLSGLLLFLSIISFVVFSTLILPPIIILTNLFETCFFSKFLSHIIELLRSAINFIWAVFFLMLSSTYAAIYSFRPAQRVSLAKYLSFNVIIIFRQTIVTIVYRIILRCLAILWTCH